MVDILTYPLPHRTKSRSLQNLGGKEEAAIYDLIFNEVPLRKVAHEVGLSYQGVYIRALAYMQYWSRLGEVAMTPKHVEYLTGLYSSADNNEEGDKEIKTK